MNKPPFDPTKPFEVVDSGPGVKPPFDPTQPFEVVEEPAQPSLAEKAVDVIATPPTPAPTDQGAADVVLDAAKATASSLIPTSLEDAKATFLDPRAGKAGMMKFMEQLAARVQDAVNNSKATGPVVEIAAPMLRPSAIQEALGMEAAMGAAGIAKEGVKAKLHLSAGRFANDMARRALGYTKQFFKEPEDFERANEVAREMLKQTVKDPVTGKTVNVFSASTESMMQRAEILSTQAGKKIDKILTQLDEAGVRSANLDELVNKVVTQLDPGKPAQGAYKVTKKALKEVIDTINAHVDDIDEAGNLTFSSAQQLKQALKDVANFNKNTDATKASIFRRAYGIVREAIDESVAKVEQLAKSKLKGLKPKVEDTEAAKRIINAYKESIQSNVDILPVVLDGSDLTRVVDGNHRLAAYQQLGKSPTFVTVDDRRKFIELASKVGEAEAIKQLGKPYKQIDANINILKEYMDSKGIYGKAEEALGALTNKLGTELGNNIAGLRETIIAAGQLARGNVVGAAVTGFSKPVTQKGAAVAAKVATSLQKYLKTVPPNKRQTVLKALVNAGVLSGARKYYNEFASRGINLPKEPKREVQK